MVILSLKEISNEQALSCMTTEEKCKWNDSSCKDCKYFGHFSVEENYDNFPMYFNCSARNTTGHEFVKEAMICCSFFERKKLI